MCLDSRTAWKNQAHHHVNVLQVLQPGRAYHQPTGMSTILLTAPTKQQQSEPLAGVHFIMQTSTCSVSCQLLFAQGHGHAW